MTEDTVEDDVALEKNTLSDHSLCDGDTLIHELTMPGGLPAIREGFPSSVLSTSTRYQA